MTLRRTPADFQVREQLTKPWSEGLAQAPGEKARFAVYRLTKTSMTTPEAAGSLARGLKVKPGDVQHAGLKDKHAETVQHLTVATRRGDAADRLPAEVSGLNWSAQRVGWASEPLSAEAIERNQFTLVVRGLSREECKLMEQRALLLQNPTLTDPGLLFVNYFGDQRFGSARHGEGFAARCLIKGDFEGALKLLIGTPARKDSGSRRTLTRLMAQHWGDWKTVMATCPGSAERRGVEVLAGGGSFKDAFLALPSILQEMSIEAYQSHLWNSTARLLMKRLSETWEKDFIRADDDFGELIFPPAAMVQDRHRGTRVPMVGPELELSGVIGAAIGEVLKDEGLTLEALRVPGLKKLQFGVENRPLFQQAERVVMSRPAQDEFAPAKSTKPWKKTVDFSLGRGSYATVVLRGLGQ